MLSPAPVYARDLSDLRWLLARASVASPGTLKGKAGVRLEDGLLIVPNLDLPAGAVEVEIAAPGPAYPGVAFRMADPLNFELLYTQPHCSGLWDAMQYDPVFHGSNTWQIHHGPAFQQKAALPTGHWYSFRVEFQGDAAWASIGEQPPFVVRRMARADTSGALGLWTYRPAYFRNLRIYNSPLTGPPEVEPDPATPKTHLPPGTVTEWFAEGYGTVMTEPSGILLLNRYLPMTLKEVTLWRRFNLKYDAEVKMTLGFSDDCSLSIDDENVFNGTNTFRPSPDRAGRGYVQPCSHKVSKKMQPGEHKVSAKVRVTEPFGWGLAFTITAEGLELLPARNL